MKFTKRYTEKEVKVMIDRWFELQEIERKRTREAEAAVREIASRYEQLEEAVILTLRDIGAMKSDVIRSYVHGFREHLEKLRKTRQHATALDQVGWKN